MRRQRRVAGNAGPPNKRTKLASLSAAVSQFKRCTASGFVLWLLATGTPPIGAEPPLVYVAPLPSPLARPAATTLAQQIRVALDRRGIRTLGEPTGQNAGALEEITSASKVAGTQVSVGIRLVSGGVSCVRAPAPQVTPPPEAGPTTASGLGVVVRQAQLAQRSRASQRLAKQFSGLGRGCKASPDWASDYFFKEASGATVVLDIAASRAESLAAPAAEAIVLFLGEGGYPTSE